MASSWSTQFSLFAVAALTACGGGNSGDGSGSGTAGPSAEGVYGGTLTGSSSSDFQMLVLENGDVWAMYGTQTNNLFLVAGFIAGSGTSNAGTFTATDVRDYGFAPALSGSANATYNAAAKTITGSVSASGGSIGFSGGPIRGSLYNYDAAATLSAVSGPWTVIDLLGESIAVSVSATGAVAGIGQFGCLFSGSITPRPSGKNVFNVSLSFGGAPCRLANQPASGIAVVYPLASGQSQLIFVGTNTSRTLGTAAFGTR